MHSIARNGFTDLRVGHGARGIGDDSVWPSFTDIMTVIVMVFLMALVIMMARNFELDRQLTTSVSAREASLLENQTLVAKLGRLESQVASLQESLGESVTAREALQARLLAELQRIEALASANVDLESQLAAIIRQRNQLAQEKQQLAAQGETARRQIAGLTATETQLRAEITGLTATGAQLREEVGDLTAAEAGLREQVAALRRQFSDLQLSLGARIETLTGENLSLSERQSALTSQLAQVRELLQTEVERSRALSTQVESQQRELLVRQRLLEQLQLSQRQAAQRDRDARAEIDRLNAAISRRLAENAALQAQADAAGVRARSLQEEYEALDAKYRDLVRPARSSAGKYVVDVRFSRLDGAQRFQLKQPEDDESTNYSRAQLEARLAALRAQHGEALYTRVIIPADNQLTHDEAWRFTQDILQNYDYYYQQYPEALGAPAQPLQ
ncbi:MAG: hypothetical protein OXU71_06180 [Gammaproteobacteria bacterium]|nr:hypothetical protein [Gammaproteobacteria bacterium]